MNSVCLTGRLTKQPELRTTETQKSVCKFSIAVNRIGSEDADFINCQVWGNQAENLCKYQNKGSLIGVTGALRLNKYQDKQGENRYETYVLASNIEYLSSKSEKVEEVIEEVDPFANADIQTLTEDDELPF